VRLVAAITPFNHPLNQVVHKIAPAIAAGAPMILKPSDKTPLTALKVAELLYEAGLPGWMLSVFVGPIDTVVTPLITDERVELVSFTGSVDVGKQIANAAGYKKLCLELGGNSPLIILDDADLDLAVHLAAEGAFRNSGQRCTAVKRLLVQEGILDAFTTKFVAKAATYLAGDPEDESTIVGTVIDEESAATLEARVQANVSRQSEIVVKESFGPLAPIIPIRDLVAAIAYYNSGTFALSTGIVTTNLDLAMRACKELQAGTTNVNEVPGYRLEMTPFGGLKDSGLGIKEGVSEAVKFMTNTKTFSLPW
jgi:aldehyde dehydrogenase (NAD+)